VILSPDEAYLSSLAGGGEVERAVRWTDEATSLFPLLR
jgi:hypothetical protein